jgi:hypothetical protein
MSADPAGYGTWSESAIMGAMRLIREDTWGAAADQGRNGESDE